MISYDILWLQTDWNSITLFAQCLHTLAFASIRVVEARLLFASISTHMPKMKTSPTRVMAQNIIDSTCIQSLKGQNNTERYRTAPGVQRAKMYKTHCSCDTSQNLWTFHDVSSEPGASVRPTASSSASVRHSQCQDKLHSRSERQIAASSHRWS